MVHARMVAPGPRGARVPSEVVEAAAAPLVLGARAPAVGHFIHWQLREVLMQQGVEIGSAFAKVCRPACSIGADCMVTTEACICVLLLSSAQSALVRCLMHCRELTAYAIVCSPASISRWSRARPSLR